MRVGHIESVFGAFRNIYGIGAKKAKLLLRMLVSLFDLEDLVKAVNPLHLVYAQPIDVWVYRAARRLQLIQTSLAELFTEGNGIGPKAAHMKKWMVGG